MRKQTMVEVKTPEQIAAEAARRAERQNDERLRRLRCGVERGKALEWVANTMRAGAPRAVRINCYPHELMSGEPVPEHCDSVSVEVERGWGVSCRLEISMRMRWEREEHAVDRTEKVVLIPCDVRVELGWSSTGRDIETAVACVALYRDMVELGAEIKAAFSYGVYVQSADHYRAFVEKA